MTYFMFWTSRGTSLSRKPSMHHVLDTVKYFLFWKYVDASCTGHRWVHYVQENHKYVKYSGHIMLYMRHVMF